MYSMNETNLMSESTSINTSKEKNSHCKRYSQSTIEKKVDFIKDVERKKKKDPKISVSQIGRKSH